MSLLKQLLISVSLAILIILGGILWLSVDSARHYLNTQLQSQTDSAVTSLALTLSQPSNQDPITQELIIMALFDSGQFSRIELTDTQNNSLFVSQIELSAAKSKAPNWFVQMLPIVAAQASAQVSDGWRQTGQVNIQADVTYARDSLWQNFIASMLWVVGAGALWALFVLFLIRWLRRVLHEEVTEKLQALTQEESQLSPTPYKRSTFTELEEVTQAIATARQSIMATAEEQHAKIESLEIELNLDAVTGLVNRKYFINDLRRQLESEQGQGGWIFLFRQRDLAAINKVITRANVDEWLQSLSQQIQDVLKQYSQDSVHLSLARLNGSDFAILGAGLALEAQQPLIHEVQHILRQQRIQLPSGDYCRWAMAQTDFKSGQYLAHVMARLDQALMRAESAGHNAVELFTSSDAEQATEQPKGGESQWRTVIQTALVEQGFGLELSAKPLRQVGWFEAGLVLHPKTKGAATLFGYQFMPVATRLGLSGVCDLRAFELAIAHLQTHPSDRIVLRVSLASIVQEGFIEQVSAQLALNAVEIKKRLAVELDAYALVSEPVKVAELTAVLAQHGALRSARRVFQFPRVLLDLTPLHLSHIRVTTADLLEIVNKQGGEIMLRSALEICQNAAVSFIFDGDLTQLPELSRQMLQEYGK